MRYLTRILQAALVLTLIITLLPLAEALKPATIVSAPPMSPGYSGPGTVSGWVTAPASHGLSGAYVAIVNAADPAQAFYEGAADENGFYTFPAVNNTMAGDSPVLSYRLYASFGSCGESLSDPFGVGESSTARVNLSIRTKPAQIVLTPERDHIVADGADRVVISAYVTDALGHPVEDGTLIDFWLDERQWLVYGEKGNGTLSPGSSFAPCFKVLNVATKGGRANVTFGWANYEYAGCSKEIKAYYAQDYNIYASTGINYRPVLGNSLDTSTLYGIVQDIHGKPFGSAAVTLHLMGRQPNGSVSEIYARTTISSTDKPYPGTYVFEDIPWDGNFTYGYLTARADVTEGATYTGTSENFTRLHGWTCINLYFTMPDEIRLTVQPDTIPAGGNRSLITAQLYLNGKPYKMAGVGITFSIDSDAAGYLSTADAVVTDNNGRATVNLTSRNVTADVNVTGFFRIGISRKLAHTRLVHIVGQGGTGAGGKNDTSMQNATEKLSNATTGQTISANSSANPGPITPTATPAPEKPTAAPGTGGSPVIYAGLAIAALATAGLAVYLLAFRKK